MKIIRISETDSTNSWLSANSGTLEAPCMVYALCQTAGRGQRGNSWESEPGMNLTASVLLRPGNIAASSQFVISEAVALSVVDLLAEKGVEAKVKWPNDIYVGDCKICGILIENAILGREITRSIAGIGININQKAFLSDAPNPVSLTQLTGIIYDLEHMAALLAGKLSDRMLQTAAPAELHREFMRKLWRGDGTLYPFLDRRRGERISASIVSVAPDGILTLQTSSGECRTFAFKEVEFLLRQTSL